MKRVLSFVFALVATVSFCISAFAGTVTTVPTIETTPIKATYSSSGTSEVETVFSVDISWGSLEYTYNLNDEKTWNPEKLAYDTSSETAEWTCEDGADTITVTNHSNTAVTATFAYTQSTGYTGITGSFTGDSLDANTLSLEAPAENSDVSSAPSGSVRLGLEGEFSNVEANTQIGSVTIVIDEYVPFVPTVAGEAFGGFVFSTTEETGVFISNSVKLGSTSYDENRILINYANPILINGTNYWVVGNNTFESSGTTFAAHQSKDFTLTTIQPESYSTDCLKVIYITASMKIDINTLTLTVYNDSYSPVT